ncbi:hypothetical protein TrRE_jg7039 [Triparma retinervis]|uniref:Uncharacterized protein n=1 Tax=Triparma retinervis TaxID=2557542 RepID=A0A9W7CGX7_9STRA|nr:hypothetical protein TrRE_jg7039 [Triparma retinervis]
MKCSMGTPCDVEEYTFWNWQKDMLHEVEAGVRREGLWFLQDEESIDMWNNGLGCGHDDLLVFDKTGRVSDYFPSENSYGKLEKDGVAEEKNITFVEQDLLTEEGYANVKNAVVRAGGRNDKWCKIPPSGDTHGQSPSDMDDTEAKEGLLFVAFIVFVFGVAIAIGRHFVHKEDKGNGRWTKLRDVEDGEEDFELGKLRVRQHESTDPREEEEEEGGEEDVFDEW